MAVLNPNSKVVCCCAGGQIRSVCKRRILQDKHGYKNVLSCGLEKNSKETLDMLFAWADVILVVGEKQLADRVPEYWRAKMRHLDVGLDNYHSCFHQELQNRLEPMLQQLM